MRILHICCFNPGKISGPAQSVENLALAQQKNRIVSNAQVLNVFNGSISGVPLLDNIIASKNNTKDQINHLVRSSDIVNFHGVYIVAFPLIAQACRRYGVPYIVSPRSHLMRAAMRKSWIKKTVFNFIIFNQFVRLANARHFLTVDEVRNSRFNDLPHFVAGNGVHIPASVVSVQNEPVCFQFIGRKDLLHKGLDLLLKGVLKASKTIRDNKAKVKINGPSHRGGGKQLAKILYSLDLQDIVEVGDAVRGCEKADALHRASVFLHTSRYEGQPQAVLEAWAAGRPALLTEGTNLSSIMLEHSTGWLTGMSDIEIAYSLEYIIRNPSEIVVKGQAARSFAEKHLTWQQVAEKTLDGYNRVLQREKKNIAA